MISSILESYRAEIQKYFCAFLVSNENFEICFLDLLTFTSSVWYVQPEFDVVRSINKTASDKRDAAAIPSQLDESISDTRNWPNFCVGNKKSSLFGSWKKCMKVAIFQKK